MSLAHALTTAQLRARAGRGYERGERYWRQGRVSSYVVRPDLVTGIVNGSEAYHVRLLARGKQLEADCTCPLGVRGELCKHAVALALHHLAVGETATRVVGETAPSFATRAELDAWASAHRVEFELDVTAEVIAPELESLHASAWHLRRELALVRLRDVGSIEGASRMFAGAALRQRAAEVVAQRLEQTAADIATGIAEERERAATSGADGSTGDALWTSLVELRRQLRAKAVPRSRAARATGAWSFDRDGLAIEWREPIKLRGPSYTIVPLVARLRLEPAAATACACRLPACTHVLALIDATLDRLEAGDPAAREAAIELGRPPWQRALAALADDEATAAAKAQINVEVWWEIDQELGNLAVTPVVKRELKKGGMSAGTRITAVRLLREHGSTLSDRDRDIANYVDNWRTEPTTSYPVSAFAALVGHPRAMFAGDPIAVRRCPLGFTAVDLSASPSGDAAVRGRAPAGDLSASPSGDAAVQGASPGRRSIPHRHPAMLPSRGRAPAGGLSASPSGGDGGDIRLEPSVDGARFSPRLLAPLLETFPPNEPLILLESEHGRCTMIDVGDHARRVWAVLARHGDTFPPEAHAQLFERLAKLEQKLPVGVPTSLLGDEIQEPTTVVLRLRLQPDTSLELEPFVRAADGGPLYPAGVGPRDVMITRDGKRSYVRRDLGSERAKVDAALAALPIATAEEGPPNCYRIEEPDAALTVVAAVQTLPAGVVAEWVDARARIVASAGLPQLRVAIEQKRDWFGMTGGVTIEAGRIELAVLLDAARRQQRFVRLDEHRWVELAAALRTRLGELADRTFEGSGGQLEVSVAAVPAVRALADEGAEVDSAATWQQLATRLAAATKLRPRPPKALKATLRPYQVEGHAWLSRLAAWGAGACLADDMGLGKTVQAIALLIDRAAAGPALVLAPTSVALNWVDELKRFGPSLNPIVYGESGDRIATLAALGKNDVLIASYGLMTRDIEPLARIKFATLVADEAQALKNPRTERARAARAIDAEFRVALSGTPLENHLGELWSLFSIAFPGLLGSWEQFRSRFAVPIERNNNAEARAALAHLIRPFLLRRTKAEVAPDLPPRTEIGVPIALSSEERELYEDARLAAVAHLDKLAKNGDRDERRRFQVLAALTRLRLLASHPKLYDATSAVSSSKMQRLLELVEELRSEGHRTLVFSQFTSHLALVRAELERAGVSVLYLDGATPATTRRTLIERFQAGEATAFLISLKAGGTGINLTGADNVIHLDPWWNPAVEDQATDRAHRIGQDKPVTVYRLIARGTVEEKILAMHATKRALVAGVLEGTDAAARLTTGDLVDLIAAQA